MPFIAGSGVVGSQPDFAHLHLSVISTVDNILLSVILIPAKDWYLHLVWSRIVIYKKKSDHSSLRKRQPCLR